jgi:hypothetical protein
LDLFHKWKERKERKSLTWYDSYYSHKGRSLGEENIVNNG